jgi:hypothetical protein
MFRTDGNDDGFSRNDKQCRYHNGLSDVQIPRLPKRLNPESHAENTSTRFYSGILIQTSGFRPCLTVIGSCNRTDRLRDAAPEQPQWPCDRETHSACIA